MDLQGNQLLNLPIDVVWNHLLDPAILEKVVPGITRLEETSPMHFDAISEIKVGPVKGSFTGKLKITDLQEPFFFTLELQQDSSMGSARGKINVKLESRQQMTQVEYQGEAFLTGLLARFGNRVLGGVVNQLTRQFFTDFETTVLKRVQHLN